MKSARSEVFPVIQHLSSSSLPRLSNYPRYFQLFMGRLALEIAAAS